VKTLFKHPEFRVGVAELAAVAPGIAAWGLMTGVAMVKSGMSLTEVLLMAILVFAGSSQLAALPLIVAGAPMWVILATSFCVNLRFMVFSAHLRPYVMHQGLWRRMAFGYGMADLNYVLFTKRFPHPSSDAAGIAAQDAYWIGSCGMSWVSWVGATLVGIMWSLATTRLRAVSAAIAGAAAVATFALPLKLNILVGIAAAVVVCLILEKTAPARPEASPGTGDTA
jgi:predicted branched-subunit amino acid permease